jgi:hypothetical protein
VTGGLLIRPGALPLRHRLAVYQMADQRAVGWLVPGMTGWRAPGSRRQLARRAISGRVVAAPDKDNTTLTVLVIRFL